MNLFRSFKRRAAAWSGRKKAVGLFFATSLSARAVGITCQLIQVPIAMKALGPEAFGLWMTLTSIGYVIIFADFGLGQGAQNKLAEAFAQKHDARARELWGSTLAVFGLVSGFLIAVVPLVTRAVDFGALFGLTDPEVRSAAPTAVAVALWLFAAAFFLGLAQRLAYSRQQGWMHNIVQAIGGIGALGGIVLATRQHWALPGIILATQLPLLAALAGLFVVQHIQLGWTTPRGFRVRGRTVRELFGLGAYFGVQQVQLTLFLALPQIIISTSLGAAAVTPYNLAQRLFNLFAIIQNAFMLPLWPAYSEARARGEFDWIRRTLTRSIGATLLCTIAPMAAGAIWARPVLGAWLSDTSDLPSVGLIWLLFVWNALSFLQQPFGYMLAGMSVVRRPTVFAVVSVIASAALMAALARPLGPTGVVIGMIVGFMPFLVLGNIVEAVRVLQNFPPPSRTVPPSFLQPRPEENAVDEAKFADVR